MPKLNYRTGMHRPDDPDIITTVTAGFLKGLSIRAIAAQAQIGKTTLMDWLSEGRREIERFSRDGTELGSHGRFAAQVENAYAAFESANVDVIERSKHQGGKGFIPALAHLRSRNPAEWVEQRQLSIQQDVRVLTASLPALAERELLALLKAKVASGRKLLN